MISSIASLQINLQIPICTWNMCSVHQSFPQSSDHSLYVKIFNIKFMVYSPSSSFTLSGEYPLSTALRFEDLGWSQSLPFLNRHFILSIVMPPFLSLWLLVYFRLLSHLMPQLVQYNYNKSSHLLFSSSRVYSALLPDLVILN